MGEIRKVRANVTGVGLFTLKSDSLSEKNRIKSGDSRIVEKVWAEEMSSSSREIIFYSACYIKKWYWAKPKLRLMTENGVVDMKVVKLNY